MTAIDLSERRRVHVVAVGGTGMSAIAEVLVGMGHQVTGSDARRTPGLERVAALGVRPHVGYAAANVGDVDALAVSTAIGADNPEVVEARRRGVPVLSRAEVLAAICARRRTLAVAGTHGKTTTSSMAAVVLTGAGMRPSFVVGGEILGLGSGGRWGGGEWLVAEADESDGTFLDLPRELALVTSVEPDHLDHYGGYDALVVAFERFLAGAGDPRLRLVCADDEVAAQLGRRCGARSYGTHESADFRMSDVVGGRASVRFALAGEGEVLGEVVVPAPGLHNARNGAAALAAAVSIGARFDAAAAALAGWGGVARRFQHRGERDGVTFVDDYAHLPTEVAGALSAARDGGWERVVCVFQPHRFSRTSALWRDFAPSFDAADVVLVTDVYAAGEPPLPGISGRLIATAVLDRQPAKPVVYAAERSDLIAELRQRLRPGDLCLTLGAGDLTTLPDELLGPADDRAGPR